MRASNFYRNLSVFLALLNLAALAFLFFSQQRPQQAESPPFGPPPPHGAHPKGLPPLLAKMIGDDEVAVASFQTSVARHQTEMHKLGTQKRQLLRRYFGEIISADNALPEGEKDALLQAIQAVERDQILSAFQHLQEVRALCPAEESADCELFMERSLNHYLIGPRKKPGPPRERLD